jgi:hypothetical protein
VIRVEVRSLQHAIERVAGGELPSNFARANAAHGVRREDHLSARNVGKPGERDRGLTRGEIVKPRRCIRGARAGQGSKDEQEQGAQN